MKAIGANMIRTVVHGLTACVCIAHGSASQGEEELTGDRTVFFEDAAELVAARIVIEPGSPVILGDPVSVRVENLPRGKSITIRAEEIDALGSLWRSSGVFRVSDAGSIDPGAQAPEEGTYRGVDPQGLFWSMKKTDEEPIDWPTANPRESLIRFAVVAENETIASGWHKRILVAPEVTVEEIQEPGFVARFYAPDSGTPAPGVIVLGGAEGGIPALRAGLLASHGYAALALAYYRAKGLSPRFADLPLEIVETAIGWLEDKVSVDAARIAVIGTSKGAELALLSAARFPKIKAVAAFAPSHVVWQGILTQGSSWSYEGESLPFVPYNQSPEFARTGLLVDLYESSLALPGWPTEALIPAEEIQGPILLVSGRKDAMWNSTGMAERVVSRLEKANHPFEFRHVAYDEAGHHVMGPGYRRYRATTRSGGVSGASAQAQADSWRQLLKFLDEHLRANP